MRSRLSLRCLVLLLCFVAEAASVMAVWPSDPTVNVALCVQEDEQGGSGVAMAGDGSGGAIVVWGDTRNGSTDLYARRVAADGTPLWAENGVALCIAGTVLDHINAVSDGAGGAIVVWRDRRGPDYDVYAQRIDGDGNLLWPSGAPSTDGIAVCDLLGDQLEVVAAGDGAGGVIAVWQEDYNGLELTAQRLDGSGQLLWPLAAPSTSGITVSNGGSAQLFPSVASDSAGGAVIAWSDGRNSSDTNMDIYAQRVAGNGSKLWGSDGVAVCNADVGQTAAVVANDGTGGAIIAWKDPRDAYSDIYAQRISDSGIAMWTVDGVIISDAYYFQNEPQIVSDGFGGAIIAWPDFRDSAVSHLDIYAQRVGGDGIVQWTGNGVAVSTADNQQQTPLLVATGDGGALISWIDRREDTTNMDVYAQRLSAAGVAMVVADGEPIATSPFNQSRHGMVGDGSGGAIIGWQDWRSGTSGDIYCQRTTGGAVIFADGFESGATGAWSGVVP